MTKALTTEALKASDLFKKFVHGYIVCALWSSTDDQGEPLDDGRDEDDLDPDCRKEMEEDCLDFVEAQWTLLCQYERRYHPTNGHNVWECAGHDFWLTRNGHGAGFWDRGLGDLGNKLTDAARVYSSVDLYVGDDDKIYN